MRIQHGAHNEPEVWLVAASHLITSYIHRYAHFLRHVASEVTIPHSAVGTAPALPLGTPQHVVTGSMAVSEAHNDHRHLQTT